MQLTVARGTINTNLSIEAFLITQPAYDKKITRKIQSGFDGMYKNQLHIRVRSIFS